MSDKRKIEQVADACVQCGACRPVCPVHMATRREEHAPRGKLKLYQALLSGRAGLSARNLKPLQQCLLCGRCQKSCPGKIEVTDALKQGRAWLQRKNMARLLGRVLLSPVLPRFMRAAWPIKKMLGQGIELRLRPLKRLPALRQQPPVARSFSTPGPRLGLFVGCMATYARPGLAEKTMALLGQIGSVRLLTGCCGLAAQSAGDTAGLRKAGKNLYAQCSGLDKIITMCTSCAHAIDHEHGARYKDLPPTTDISQLLAEHLPLLKDRAKAKRAYLHISCHLEDGQALKAWLLEAGVDFTIIDACCGGGGLLPLSNPGLSGRITPQPADRHIPVLTTCSGCYLQWLQTNCEQVLHPLELLFAE